jgi:hypothetical protein
MSKRIVIIGAGLAGAIAYASLREYNPIVFDVRPEPKGGELSIHPAVMRLRDPKVAELIGAEYEEVIVSKGIFYQGSIYTQSNILFNNLYSRKVYQALGRRSLNELGDVKRYIIKGYKQPGSISWETKVTRIHKGSYKAIPLRNGKCDHIISTIPMFAVRNLLEEVPEDLAPLRFEYLSVYVLRLRLKTKSTVHQTLYYPASDTPIYRITLQSQDIIIESTEPRAEFIELLKESFGLDYLDLEPFVIYPDGSHKNDWKEMPLGKIVPIDEMDRLRYIMWLTDEHKIFSFGRYAVWRPLRTDQLIQDIYKIKRIIKAGDIKARYQSRM